MEALGFKTDKAWDYENGYYLTSPVSRLAKAVAHYELYKRIIHLPGAVVECGVFKGASLIRWATYREILESQDSRKIVGFDAFGKFPRQLDPDDNQFISNWEGSCGDGIGVDALRGVLARKGIDNVELVPGDVMQTVPKYIETRSHLKIALLHLDMDVTAPTLTALRCLWRCVVPGGLLVLDDYGMIPGATRAVDQFFHDDYANVEKLTISRVPAFIVKEGR